MNRTDRFLPHVTVAAVIERAGRYLMVEEHTSDGLRINQPAGHIDAHEAPLSAVVRETLEETAHAFTPEALLGVYQLDLPERSPHPATTYFRWAFIGQVGDAPEPGRTLDSPIVRVLWLTVTELETAAAEGRLRTPLVLQCVRDHQAGVRHPLSVLRPQPGVGQA